MKILLAVDDDPLRAHAIRAVRDWLKAEDAQVVALHVGATVTTIPPGGWPPVGGGGLVGYPYISLADPPPDEEFDRHALEVASRAAQATEGEARVEMGNASSMILKVANEIRADLIVVGTGDRSWLSRMVEPSVGHTVADEAPCSVLIVREPRYETPD